jgi:hypothetical protein
MLDLTEETGWGLVNFPEENGYAAAGAADPVGFNETALESWCWRRFRGPRHWD